jgi:hypothetical protein
MNDLELNFDELDINYDPHEVNMFLQKKEIETLEQKLNNLVNELNVSLNELREQVKRLELNPSIGKVCGNSNFFTRHKNGIKVYGDTLYKNKHLLKELGGTWNPELKCWFFPYNRKGNLKMMGLTECDKLEIRNLK